MKSICGLFFLLATSLFAQRLPQSVIPGHYQLTLDPSIEEKKFSGEETIDVQLKSSVDEIVMNSLDLDISSAEITSGGTTQRANVIYDKPDEMVRLRLPGSIPVGPAQVHLQFAGTLTEGLRGLYLSKSSRREYAVTQFEGTYARMMFPCFDEPGFKATFDLTVRADQGDTAISNGRISKDEPISGNRHEITFSTSARMSTYLVALAVGDWECQSRTVDGVPIRVCAVPEKKEYGAFALDVAAHSLQFYNQWYGIKYPFGKLDMVAIPDYEWGGMENTASIFYRDTALLLDEKHAPVFRKRGQAVTIAHEIAHQWFGDLVTAAWWDDIWLNEGFATWMARKPIEAWYPEWNLEDDAAAEAQQIIGVDSLASARAIHGNPSTPSQIKEMFDGITYEKGGAVLRMLESYLGPETFRKGVNAYLAAHANGNASAADFWQAEAQTSGKPVDQIMPPFVLQPGVPIVSLSNSCNGGVETVELKQQRFFLSPKPEESANQLWQIPVCTKTNANPRGSCTLVTRLQQTESLGSCTEWVFGNRDAKGYYRLTYSPQDLKAIADAAEERLNVPERIGLVEDAWAMTRTGRTSVQDFLDLTKSLRSEQDRHVIDSLSNHLDYIEEALAPAQDQKRKFDAFLRAQFATLAQELGWKSRANDTDEQKALRSSLLEILGSAGDSSAIAASRKLVEEYMSNPPSADATLIGSAFIVAAENGDQELNDRFEQALNQSKSSDQYYHYMYALAAFRQPQFVNRTLALIEQGKIRRQDYPRFFGALLANPASRDTAWKYLKDHWDSLAQIVTSFGGAGAVSALGSACSVEMRDDISHFFADHHAPGAERTLRQTLERIDGCIEFKRHQEPSLTQSLSTLSDRTAD